MGSQASAAAMHGLICMQSTIFSFAQIRIVGLPPSCRLQLEPLMTGPEGLEETPLGLLSGSTGDTLMRQ